MKKTVKTLSVLLMAMAMSLCFFVAGGLFVKAEVVATTTDKLVAVDGASVLIVDKVADTGIKFDVEISASNYNELLTKASNEEGALVLGVQLGTEKDGEFALLLTEEGEPEERIVSVSGTNLFPDDGDVPAKYQYSFSITYNLDNIFGDNIDQEKLNQMYSFKLAVKPFYAIYVDGEIVEKAYGEAGDARSMLHVAQAEMATGKNLPSGFADKYIAETVTGLTATVDSNGVISADNGEYDVVSYTIGTSAKSYAPGEKVGKSALNYTEGASVPLFGYTADRKVIAYNATYVVSNSAINVTDEVILATGTSFYAKGVYVAEGEAELTTIGSAIYFKGVKDEDGNSLENKESEILSVLYNGNSIYSAGVFNLSAISTDLLGEVISLTVVMESGTYNMSNVRLVTTAFEDTASSRQLFAKLFSGDSHKDGYYVLLENLNFDITSDAEVGGNGGVTKNAADESLTYTGDFSGVFDGRGYALNNTMLRSGSEFGIFGYKVCSGSAIKNVAINGLYTKAVGADATTKTTNTMSMLFHSSKEATLDFTMENVYIYRYTQTSGGNNCVFFYSYKYDGSYVTWNYKFTNTLIVLELDEGLATNTANIHNYGRTIGADSVIKDTYWVTNGSRGDIKSGSADGKIAYYEHAATGAPAAMADIWQAMIDANNNYSNMYATKYWVQGTNGLPVWKSLQG